MKREANSCTYAGKMVFLSLLTIALSPADAPAALAETAAAHSDLFRRLALHKAFGSFGSAGEHVDGAR